MATSPVKHFMVTYLMPSKCYEELFVNFRVHVPCMMILLNKAFGFWILLDNFLAQLCQLLKLLWRRRADGLSLTCALLQLYACSCPVVYAIAYRFPLFAWGERLFTLAQTAAIVFLILHYRGDTLKGMLLLLVYSGAMFLLGRYASLYVASVMHASRLGALIASKGFQAGTNYRNGHTGYLSTLSVFLTWAGSLGTVFLSLQETGSSLETMSHTLSACLSCILLAQVLCNGSSSDVSQKKKSD